MRDRFETACRVVSLLAAACAVAMFAYVCVVRPYTPEAEAVRWMRAFVGCIVTAIGAGGLADATREGGR